MNNYNSLFLFKWISISFHTSFLCFRPFDTSDVHGTTSSLVYHQFIVFPIFLVFSISNTYRSVPLLMFQCLHILVFIASTTWLWSLFNAFPHHNIIRSDSATHSQIFSLNCLNLLFLPNILWNFLTFLAFLHSPIKFISCFIYYFIPSSLFFPCISQSISSNISGIHRLHSLWFSNFFVKHISH